MHAYMHLRTHMYVCVHTYVCMQMYTHMHMHMCMCACVHVHYYSNSLRNCSRMYFFPGTRRTSSAQALEVRRERWIRVRRITARKDPFLRRPRVSTLLCTSSTIYFPHIIRFQKRIYEESVSWKPEPCQRSIGNQVLQHSRRRFAKNASPGCQIQVLVVK